MSGPTPRPVWRLKVRDEFSAGHALRHYQGKCERLHGHNFGVELVVEGERLTKDTEFLLDFKVLKTTLKNVLAELDHNVLNETAPFAQLNPTSENLARFIFQQTAARLAAEDDPQARTVRVVEVSVSEKGSQSAAYMETETKA